jgi:hypothetical protein
MRQRGPAGGRREPPRGRLRPALLRSGAFGSAVQVLACVASVTDAVPQTTTTAGRAPPRLAPCRTLSTAGLRQPTEREVDHGPCEHVRPTDVGAGPSSRALTRLSGAGLGASRSSVAPDPKTETRRSPAAARTPASPRTQRVISPGGIVVREVDGRTRREACRCDGQRESPHRRTRCRGVAAAKRTPSGMCPARRVGIRAAGCPLRFAGHREQTLSGAARVAAGGRLRRPGGQAR